MRHLLHFGYLCAARRPPDGSWLIRKDETLPAHTFPDAYAARAIATTLTATLEPAA